MNRAVTCGVRGPAFNPSFIQMFFFAFAVAGWSPAQKNLHYLPLPFVVEKILAVPCEQFRSKGKKKNQAHI